MDWGLTWHHNALHILPSSPLNVALTHHLTNQHALVMPNAEGQQLLISAGPVKFRVILTNKRNAQNSILTRLMIEASEQI